MSAFAVVLLVWGGAACGFALGVLWHALTTRT
jgi:hypothetical protein